MSIVWDFIQNQVLGMKWLNTLIDYALSAIGLDTSSRLGGSILFFCYDVIKIIILLSTLIFVISYIESYFPPERNERILGRFKGITANTVAALLGTVTPFCSCSSIPIFIGFTQTGLSLGVTFSFLISSPLVDLGSLILLTSIFGAKTAVTYVILGVVLAVIGGTIIDKMHMEKHITLIEDEHKEANEQAWVWLQNHRIKYSVKTALSTLKSLYLYIFIGVGIGAIIHNWIPQEFIINLLGSDNPFSVILAAMVGIPMYADIFGTIPIAEALLYKGAGLGTVLSFMMGVTALSLPSLIMLKKVLKPKLLITFTAIVTAGIIITGYLFNFAQPLFI